MQSKHLYFRLVQENDIDFILSLRLNPNLNQYLNKIEGTKEAQIAWLKEYKKREAIGTDYYFVIVDKEKGDIGLLRVYDIDYSLKTFTWGSWIIRENDRPLYAAVESAILVYEFAFFELGLLLARFVVDNRNTQVIKFHTKFGAKYLYTDETNHNFEFSKTNYIALKYSKYYKYF